MEEARRVGTNETALHLIGAMATNSPGGQTPSLTASTQELDAISSLIAQFNIAPPSPSVASTPVQTIVERIDGDSAPGPSNPSNNTVTDNIVYSDSSGTASPVEKTSSSLTSQVQAPSSSPKHESKRQTLRESLETISNTAAINIEDAIDEFRALLTSYFTLYRIVGDGNCFFRSVVKAIFPWIDEDVEEMISQKIRETINKAVDRSPRVQPLPVTIGSFSASLDDSFDGEQMESASATLASIENTAHKEKDPQAPEDIEDAFERQFAGFIETDVNDAVTMSKSGVWADHLQIAKLVYYLKRPIWIYRLDDKHLNDENGLMEPGSAFRFGEEYLKETCDPIRIHYIITPGHYETLLPLSKSSEQAPTETPLKCFEELQESVQAYLAQDEDSVSPSLREKTRLGMGEIICKSYRHVEAEADDLSRMWRNFKHDADDKWKHSSLPEQKEEITAFADVITSHISQLKSSLDVVENSLLKSIPPGSLVEFKLIEVLAKDNIVLAELGEGEYAGQSVGSGKFRALNLEVLNAPFSEIVKKMIRIQTQVDHQIRMIEYEHSREQYRLEHMKNMNSYKNYQREHDFYPNTSTAYDWEKLTPALEKISADGEGPDRQHRIGESHSLRSSTGAEIDSSYDSDEENTTPRANSPRQIRLHHQYIQPRLETFPAFRQCNWSDLLCDVRITAQYGWTKLLDEVDDHELLLENVDIGAISLNALFCSFRTSDHSRILRIVFKRCRFNEECVSLLLEGVKRLSVSLPMIKLVECLLQRCPDLVSLNHFKTLHPRYIQWEDCEAC